MSKNALVLAIVCALAAVPALGSGISGIEVTPTLGYRLGGDFDNLVLNGAPAELSLDDGIEYGLILSFPVTTRLDFEFRWSHQSTDLSSSPPFAIAPSDLTADTYMGGLVFFFPVDSEVVKPFMNVELGATQFNPNNGFSSDPAFAFAVGGGSKFMFGDHFGVRVQGSYLSSTIPGGDEMFCNTEACYTGTSRNTVGQFELTTGVVFRF